jgi:hypothetical protein
MENAKCKKQQFSTVSFAFFQQPSTAFKLVITFRNEQQLYGFFKRMADDRNGGNASLI